MVYAQYLELTESDHSLNAHQLRQDLSMGLLTVNIRKFVTVTSLDWFKFVSSKYFENELTEYGQILCQHILDLCWLLYHCF